MPRTFQAQVTVARAHCPSGTSEPWDEMIDVWRAGALALHGDVDRALEVARVPRPAPPRPVPAASPACWPARIPAPRRRRAGRRGPRARQHLSAWRAQGEPDVTGMADVLTAGSAIALAHGDLEEAELLAAGAVDITSERPTHLLGVNAEVALAEVEAALPAVATPRRPGSPISVCAWRFRRPTPPCSRSSTAPGRASDPLTALRSMLRPTRRPPSSTSPNAN